jgi:anti-sigma factor RsiW
MKKAQMDCNRVQILLPGYMDGELDLVSALEIEEHFKSCPACSQKYAELVELHALLSDSVDTLYQPAPTDLHKHIRASIQKAHRTAPTWSVWQWRQVAGAVVLVILLALGVHFAGDWLSPAKNNLVADEILSAHVRSLMADHLTDVASSDQHTVKPWFDGKLDFSPPVVDLAAQGYPLAGGRLDYLDNHQAAALVYHRNKHIINLFIWPSTSQQAGLLTSTKNGYNLYQWVQSGMSYCAISDLNTSEMQIFVGLVQKNFK